MAFDARACEETKAVEQAVGTCGKFPEYAGAASGQGDGGGTLPAGLTVFRH